MTIPVPQSWIETRPEGLYCVPGGFFIDPARPVDRAVITHGHGDHARPGHARVLATAETLAIMRHRYPADIAENRQALAYGETIAIGEATLRLVPAGHILGSAQAVMEWRGSRVVVSGDYKRRADPTCQPFEPVDCDAFVSEATFGLPVFRHPPAQHEIAKLLDSLRLFPERAHFVGVYGLGKCQRVLKLLRLAGYDEPIYLHGAVMGLTELYQSLGQDFGIILPATGPAKAEMAGKIVLAPPDPVIAMASGWMRVRARARQRGVELPLVISDHADWDELTMTVSELNAPRIWITHGREDAMVHFSRGIGRDAKALSLIGFEEDEGE
jgi:putative mRNA 3-end processing factor